jgi:hypothetical protein
MNKMDYNRSGYISTVNKVKRVINKTNDNILSKPEDNFNFQTDSVYKGEWKNNLKHGYGCLTSCCGKRYEGDWECDKRSGKGIYSRKNKSGKFCKIYEGTWQNDKMDGSGEYFYETGDVYIGEWLKGQRSGNGTLTKVSKDVYSGKWLLDQLNGFGHIRFSNGDIFHGSFENNMRNGPGKLFMSSKHMVRRVVTFLKNQIFTSYKLYKI